jgi:hypothetical protein
MVTRKQTLLRLPCLPGGGLDMEFARIGAVKSEGAADYLVQRLIKPDSWAPIPHQ